MKIVGYQVFDFVDQTGKKVNGVKFFCEDKSPAQGRVGVGTSSYSVKMEMLPVVEKYYKSGQEIDVSFNEYKKVKRIDPLS